MHVCVAQAGEQKRAVEIYYPMSASVQARTDSGDDAVFYRKFIRIDRGIPSPPAEQSSPRKE